MLHVAIRNFVTEKRDPDREVCIPESRHNSCKLQFAISVVGQDLHVVLRLPAYMRFGQSRDALSRDRQLFVDETGDREDLKHVEKSVGGREWNPVESGRL